MHNRHIDSLPPEEVSSIQVEVEGLRLRVHNLQINTRKFDRCAKCGLFCLVYVITMHSHFYYRSCNSSLCNRIGIISPIPSNLLHNAFQLLAQSNNIVFYKNNLLSHFCMSCKSKSANGCIFNTSKVGKLHLNN